MSAATPTSVIALSFLCLGLGCAQTKPGEWRPLFDGKSLQNWTETPYTDKGAVRVEKGELILGVGNPMTGVRWVGPELPNAGYEVRFEAARLQGSDFFAMLTFPVGDDFCTWVAGGWGGDIVGLSNIDDADAADNDTRAYFTFETGRWYALRIRVTLDKITAWIDEKPVTDVDISGRKIGLRYGEDKLSVPFGFTSYNTKGALRKIEFRELPVRR